VKLDTTSLGAQAKAAVQTLRQGWISVVVGVALCVGVLVVAPFGFFIDMVLGLGGGATIVALGLAAPKLQAARHGARIDDDIPFFITHFGVLATSNLPRGEVLRILSENKEYKEIAAEVGRILRLTSDWGLGLSDAVRAVAQSTPSKTFAAFLLRLAHALEAGQQLETFLMGEQRVVMSEYKSIYEADLLRVEAWKEIYTNSLMTVAFLSMFATIMPLFAGGNTVVYTAVVAGLTILLEIVMGVVLQDRLPHDRLSPNRPVRTPFAQRLRQLLMVSAGASLVIAVAAFWFVGLGAAILLATIPLAVPGLYANREEKAIRQREADYPAFIRSLGAAAAARGGAVRSVLGSLQANNLGRLTQPVRDLHRRLMWRVDDSRAWKSFGEQTESRLIDSFSDMFVQGIAAGGKPGPISDIISHNMLDVLALRTTRRATAGTFRGMLLGLGIGLALVMFMGSGILSSLSGLFGGQGELLVQQGLFSVVPQQDSDTAQQILVLLVAAHGLLAGLFFTMVQGGRLEGAAMHAAINVAAGVGMGLILMSIMPSLFSFS
jgi:flagellar protein FlaJ